jgi:hypothetical protein
MDVQPQQFGNYVPPGGPPAGNQEPAQPPIEPQSPLPSQAAEPVDKGPSLPDGKPEPSQKDIKDRVASFAQSDEEAAVAFAQEVQARTIRALIDSGHLPENPEDLTKVKQPEPAAPDSDATKQQYFDWLKREMGAHKGKDPARDRFLEMMEESGLGDILFNQFQAGIGLSTNTAKQEMERMLEERLGPMATHLEQMKTEQAQKTFFEKYDLPAEAQDYLKTRMKDDREIRAADMVDFAKKYQQWESNAARKRAEAQASKRSNAFGTGFLESPQQRGGVNPQAQHVHRTKELAKEILDATAAEDIERRNRALRRWNAE